MVLIKVWHKHDDTIQKCTMSVSSDLPALGINISTYHRPGGSKNKYWLLMKNQNDRYYFTLWFHSLAV